VRRTKIVCTLGPAQKSQDDVRALKDAGMNVARLNCSHGTWADRRQLLEWVQGGNGDGAPTGILVDLQGPKFRIGLMGDEGLEIHRGDTVTFGPEGSEIPVMYREVLQAVEAGDHILLGDGEIELVAKDCDKDGLWRAAVKSGGTVRSRRGITVVGRSFDAPSLTAKDEKDIEEAVKIGADFVALSYVRRAADMRLLRRMLEQKGAGEDIRIVCKVETREALEDIDDIIKASDVIMVARGDLGLQMNLDDVPIAQKEIIAKCGRAGKPVITATQMLESMMTLARPTRAEASDIANAILDGTDALMLSGETAAGRYPVEAVNVMSRVAVKAETFLDPQAKLFNMDPRDDSTEAIAHAAVHLAHSLKAAAILTTSTSGMTPRLISKYRPSMPVLCSCWTKKTQMYLSTVWGVQAKMVTPPDTTDDAVANGIDAFLRSRDLKIGDMVVITAGVPAGRPGNTNMIRVQTV
jgi:pyruvate kinase